MLFQGEAGLRINISKSQKCKDTSIIKKGKMMRKEDLIVQRNQWDCRYVLKEIFMNALCLRMISNLIADDKISEVNENKENWTTVKDNPPDNLHKISQNI